MGLLAGFCYRSFLYGATSIRHCSLSSLPVKAEFVVTTATSHTDRSFPSNSSVPVRTCNWCGLSYHRRLQSPAREQQCLKCGKMGHFARICKSRDSKATSATTEPLDSFAGVTDKHKSQRRFIDGILRGRSLHSYSNLAVIFP